MFLHTAGNTAYFTLRSIANYTKNMQQLFTSNKGTMRLFCKTIDRQLEKKYIRVSNFVSYLEMW